MVIGPGGCPWPKPAAQDMVNDEISFALPDVYTVHTFIASTAITNERERKLYNFIFMRVRVQGHSVSTASPCRI